MPSRVKIEDVDDLGDALDIWEDIVDELQIPMLPRAEVEYKLN
jgi:hypothetical protein